MTRRTQARTGERAVPVPPRPRRQVGPTLATGTALTLAVLLAITLGGCTMPDDRSDPQPGPVSIEAAKASMQAALDDTIAFLRPAKFVMDSTPNSEGPCDLPDGREGTSVLFRGGVADGPSGDVSTLADKVAGHWRAKGYRVKTLGKDDLAELVGTLPDGAVIIFGPPTGPIRKMTLDGETGCVAP